MNNERRSSLALTLVSVLLAYGCTALTVSRPPAGDAPPPEGLVYYLAQLEANVILTRELLKCDLLQVPEKPEKPDEPPISPVVVEITVATTLRYVADRSEAYVLQYEQLNHPFKTTSLSINLYSTGVVKSLNGTIEDKTRETIGQTIKGATSIARLTVGLPEISLLKKSKEKEIQLCTEEITAALKSAGRISKEVEDLDRRLAEAERNLTTKLKAVTDTGGAVPESFKEFETLNSEIRKIQATLAARRKDLVTAKRLLVHTQEYSVVPRFTNTGTWLVYSEPLIPDEGLVKRWFRTSALDQLRGSNRIRMSKEQQSYPVALDAYAHVVVAPRPASAQELPNCTDQNPGIGQIRCGAGLVYRQPADGQLMVCKEEPCVAEREVDKDGRKIRVLEVRAPSGDRLFSRSVAVPQAGIRASLPLRNDVFAKNTIVAEFSEDGTLTRLTYITEAQAEKGAATFAETAEAVSKVRLELMKAQTDLIEQETKRLEQETKRLEAMKKQIEAEKALRTLRQRLGESGE